MISYFQQDAASDMKNGPQTPERSDLIWREYHIYEGSGESSPEDDAAFLFQTDGEELEEMNYPIRLPSCCSESSGSALERWYNLSLSYQEDYTQSTGMAIWKGSEVMAEYLMQHPELVEDEKVLELGAGVGLVGLVAHHLGASQVVWTDGDQAVLDNLRENVQRNYDAITEEGENDTTSSCSSAEVCPQLIWGKDVEAFRKQYGQSRVILGTDLFYMKKSLTPLFQTVKRLLSCDGVFVTIMSAASQYHLSTIFPVAADNGLTCVKALSPTTVIENATSNGSPATEAQNIVGFGECEIDNSAEGEGEFEDDRIYIFARKR